MIFLFVFSLLIHTSYGQEVNQTPNDTNQSQKNGIGSSPTITTQNITIELNSTNNLPVKEATVEVIDVTGNETKYLLTNDNGLAFFQAKHSKTYRFVIEAEGYENVTKNVTILAGISENKIKFTLKPLKSQKDSGFLPIIIPALIGFIIFIYWFIRFYHGHLISVGKYESLIFNLFLIMLILSWPSVLIYLLYISKENILFGSTSFSVFIPVSALIGILSYLLLSIEEIFCQNVPKCVKKSISWAYIRRIAIAPYIAILGIYLLPDSTRQNLGSLMLFSFFTGMFTKTIEEWLYKSIRGLLPEELRIRLIERKKYSIENSELVVRLNVEEGVAYGLYDNNIKSVEQLAVAGFDTLKNQKGITKEYFNYIFVKANEQLVEIKRLKEILNLTPPELKLLTDKAKVYSIKDFANVDIDSINWEAEVATENTKISNIFKQKQIKAKEFAKSEDFKLLSFEDLKKLRDICENKAEGDFQEILSLHIDLKKLGIPGWGVDDTIEIRELPITSLKQLKEQCSTEGNLKILQDKMKDNPRILKLLKNI